MYHSMVTLKIRQERFGKLKDEIAEYIKLGYDTIDSCFLPNCMKLSRLQKVISELRGLRIIVDGYGATIDDKEPDQILSIMNSSIKDMENSYDDIREKSCM